MRSDNHTKPAATVKVAIARRTSFPRALVVALFAGWSLSGHSKRRFS